MSGFEKKELLIRLFNETRECMDDFLIDELENTIDYENPEIQEYLRVLGILFHDIMVITKKLNEELEYQVSSIILNHFLEEISRLWSKD